MLVVGTTEEHFNAVWVKNEWERFIEMMKSDKNKYLIPVISKIDAHKMPEEFAMYLAQSMDKVGAMQDLLHGIDKLMDDYKENKPDEFTYEMYEKFKKMKEEEDRKIIESQAANKKVEKVYESPIRNHRDILFMISSLQAILIFYIASYRSYFIKGYYNEIAFNGLRSNFVSQADLII